MGTTATTFKPPPSSHFLRPARPPSLPALPRRRARSRGSPGAVVAYMERNPNSVSGMAKKLLGSLPVVGLVARLLSDEGGVGGDVVDFAEFRRRVGKKCGINDSRAFYEFQERRGRAGDPLYVLLCCWLTAVGAGLLKSKEILEGVARLRLSNDIEFEEQTFMATMIDAKERWGQEPKIFHSKSEVRNINYVLIGRHNHALLLKGADQRPNGAYKLTIRLQPSI